MKNEKVLRDSFSLNELFKTHFESLILSQSQMIQADSENTLKLKITEKEIQNANAEKIFPALNDKQVLKYIYLENPTQKQNEYIKTFRRKNSGLLLCETNDAANSYIIHHLHFAINSEKLCVHYPIYLYPDFPKAGRALNFNNKILKKISLKLALEFLPEEPTSGNVCFIQNPDVRDDFKTYYTPDHLLNYLLFFLKLENKHLDKKTRIPFPNEEDFWACVRKGEKLRSASLSQGEN